MVIGRIISTIAPDGATTVVVQTSHNTPIVAILVAVLIPVGTAIVVVLRKRNQHEINRR